MIRCIIVLSLLVLVAPFNNRLYRCSHKKLSSLSSSKNSNIDIDNDTVKKLIDKIKSQDPEWLNSVFGDSLDSILQDDSNITSTNTNTNANDDTRTNNNTNDNDNTNDNTNDNNINTNDIAASINDDDYNELLALGYSNSDITVLKPSVIQIIIDKAVSRPKKDIPGVWLKNTSSNTNTKINSSNTNSNSNSRISNNNVSKQRQPKSYNDDDYSDNNSRSRSNSNNNSKSKISGSTSDRFSWSGPPVTDDELTMKRNLQRSNGFDKTNNYDARMSTTRTNSGSGSSSSDGPRLVNEYRTTGNKYADEPASFWPDPEEFKDMLLDESQWRLNMVGDWASPFVRSETKWRYQLYKRWLQLLDEGLGDGFDIVPESFGNGDDYDSYEYGDNEDSVINNDDISDRKSRGGDSRRRSQSSSLSSSSRPSQQSLERRGQANKYDDWMKEKIGYDDDQWTDVSLEEVESRRLLDDAFDERSPDSTPNVNNRDEWFGERRNDDNEVNDNENFKKAWEDSKARRPLSNAEENYMRKESNSIPKGSSRVPRESRRPRSRDFESDDI